MDNIAVSGAIRRKDLEAMRLALKALGELQATRVALETDCPTCDLQLPGECLCVERIQAVVDARLAIQPAIDALNERLLRE